MTCMGYPGTTLDKVELDAETFAEWKIDMLKLDGCFSTAKEHAQGEFLPGSTVIRREGSSCGSQSACTAAAAVAFPNSLPLLAAPWPSKDAMAL